MKGREQEGRRTLINLMSAFAYKDWKIPKVDTKKISEKELMQNMKQTIAAPQPQAAPAPVPAQPAPAPVPTAETPQAPAPADGSPW